MTTILNRFRSLFAFSLVARIGSVVQGRPWDIDFWSDDDYWSDADLVSQRPSWTPQVWRSADVEDALAKPNRHAGIKTIDRYGRTLLHWAARYSGEPSVVELLMERGADINARGRSGITPLHRWVTNNK